MNLIKKQIDAVAFGFPVRILCEKGIQKTLKSIWFRAGSDFVIIEILTTSGQIFFPVIWKKDHWFVGQKIININA